MAMPIHRPDLERLDVCDMRLRFVDSATYEGMARPPVQGPWLFVLTSCPSQRHDDNHPKSTDSSQNVTSHSLRATRRDP
jgi:hypothetical protein